jgi:hypothetical protein
MAWRDWWIPALAQGLLALGALGPGGAAAQPAELPARVVTVGGHAEISKTPSPAWKEAALRDELSASDGVRTLVGRLTVRTAGGQSLRLGPRTQLFFAPEDGARAPGPIRARLDGGRVWLAVLPNQPPTSQIELRAGPATLTARGGGVSVAMHPDGSVLVAVHHGSATCAGAAWERVLGPDQELLVPAAGAPRETAKLRRDKRDADWVKWNEQQDRAGGYGARPADD